MLTFLLAKVLGQGHLLVRMLAGMLIPTAAVLALVQLFAVPWGYMFARDYGLHRNIYVQMSLLCGIGYAYMYGAMMANIMVH